MGGRSHNRVSIDRAIKAFTAEFEEHAARNTQKKYRILLAKLKSFSHGSFGTCDLPQTCLKFYGLTIPLVSTRAPHQLFFKVVDTKPPATGARLAFLSLISCMR